MIRSAVAGNPAAQFKVAASLEVAGHEGEAAEWYDGAVFFGYTEREALKNINGS